MVISSNCFESRSKKRATDFTRERKMGFRKLVYFILSMIKESSQNALERYFPKIGEDTYMTQQAFSLARQKIKWEAFRELFDVTVNVHYVNHKEEIQRWNGLRLSAIDGVKQSLPNDPPLREYFGTCGKGDQQPTANGSALYDILNNIVLDARIEPMSVDERTLAEAHIQRLRELDSFEEWKELIVFDRGYPSFELVKGLIERKIHYVMRVREKFSVQIDALGRGDHEAYLEQGGKEIAVRVLKFRLSTGETETLITDLQDKGYDIKTFKKLYYKRWSIETKYDEIKNKLEVENFSGRLVDNIRQDFYATMVLTNLASELSAEAQKEIDLRQKHKYNKYWYKVNVNHEIGVLKDRLIMTLIEGDTEKRSLMYNEIIELLEKRVIPIRPNRSIPRVTPRKAKFHHNHKSNC